MWSLEDYCTLFNDAFRRRETIVLACRCKIRYSGRAESFLGDGDRVVVVKSDGALLVHQPTGNAPINYMKPGCTHELRVDGEECHLHTSHVLEKEKMEISIEKVYFLNSHKLEDGQSIIVAGTEEDMANMLMQQPELVEEGFKPVNQEEQTKYGFIDVLGIDKAGILTVVECKRYVADLSAVTQLRRYVEKIMVSKGISKVRGILAAPRITDNAKQMLEDWGYSFKSIKPPKFMEDFDKKQRKLEGF